MERKVPNFLAFLSVTKCQLFHAFQAFGPRKKMLNVIQHYRTSGTFLLCTDDVKPVPYSHIKERGQSESHSQQVLLHFCNSDC